VLEGACGHKRGKFTPAFKNNALSPLKCLRIARLHATIRIASGG
jgi:hypothetical protein